MILPLDAWSNEAGVGMGGSRIERYSGQGILSSTRGDVRRAGTQEGRRG